jgi:chemotaxis protein methyltransferase CheR
VTAELSEIAAMIRRESGIVLRNTQHDTLIAALQRLESAGDPATFLHRIADPVEGPRHMSDLLDEVTINETYFLRESEQLERLAWHAMLAHARKAGRESIRIWSVGCATGEEAYSLALLAFEAFGPGDPPVEILATDISAQAVERARAGNYRPRSTRSLDPAARQRYFHAENDRLVAGDRLRSLVTFARHNLFQDPVPPLGEAPFDVILCRNVLIYFDIETAGGVIASLEAALAPGGTLLLGAADALCRGAARLSITAGPAVAPRNARVPRLRPRSVAPLGKAAPDADPPEAQAHFLAGLADLEAGNPQSAIAALRRALYAEPRLGLAAFQLGRAYESLGNRSAARRAYEQALRTLEPDDDLHESLLGQVDLDDVTAAARTRLEAFEAIGHGS